MLYGLSLVFHIEKPSWCFVVKTRYFMPAAFATRTHSSASKPVGLKRS